MANEDTDNASGGWSSSGTSGLSPSDVQQKQFATARFGGGYRMREVDEFLDRVTDALTALIAENERLRGEQRSGDRSLPTAPPAVPAGSADRAAIESFLQREKGFLQSLGALVQDHAEELRGMVRAARAATPETASPQADRPAPQAAVEETAGPATATEPAGIEDADLTGPDTEAPVAADDPGEEITDRGSGEEGPSDPAEAEVDMDEPEVLEDAVTTATDAEPIRVDEPEPARARRRSDPADGSLRELFWGED